MKLRKGTTTRGIMNIIKNRRKNDIKRVTDMTVNSLNILIITFIKSVKKIFFAHHLIRKLSICYKHIIHEYSIAFIILDRNCFMRTSPVPFEMIFLPCGITIRLLMFAYYFYSCSVLVKIKFLNISCVMYINILGMPPILA